MTLTQRYLTLLALRWFPTGLIIPVVALLPLDRGLTLGELGTAMAAQGVAVLILEIPSGALADTWGRRPVYLTSAAVAVVAYALTLGAQSAAAFGVAWAVTGIFRALDSGALESWFVDAENARGAGHAVPSGLAAAGGVISASIAAGSLTSAGLLTWSPWSDSTTLAAPYVLAMCVVLLQLTTAALIMNAAPPAPNTGSVASHWAQTLRDGVRLVAGPGLRALAAAMVLIAVGVAALELFMPVRLADLTGNNTTAAAQMGVVSAVAWGLAAVGSAITSRVLRRRDPRWTAVVLIACQSVGLAVMAAATVPGVLVLGFWFGYLVHSAYGATYNSLVHARVDDARRTTALSITSMAFLGSAAAGGAILGVVAEHTSASWSLLIGAAALLCAAVVVGSATRGPHRSVGRSFPG